MAHSLTRGSRLASGGQVALVACILLQHQDVVAARDSLLIPWGAGETRVGLRPGSVERSAAGPPAVAVDPSGRIWILDPLQKRIALVDGRTVTTIIEVDEDVQDLAVGKESFATFSPLRGKVWIHTRQKEAIAISSALRHPVGLSWHERDLLIHSAYQESFTLARQGQPFCPAEQRRHKLEGRHFLGDGTGLAVRRTRGRPQLLLHVRAGERTLMRPGPLLDREVDSARIVGGGPDWVCLRLEKQVARSGPVRVDRRVVCLSLPGGEIWFDAHLRARGLYQPQQELAVGGLPPRLVQMLPQPDGLHIYEWPLRPPPGEVRP